MKNILALSIGTVFSSQLFAQTKLIEKVEKKNDEIVIPYEKYVLPNGLTLIVHEDHSDPIVHVDLTYHVGSAREQAGRSGFAHFFEHMMFQGSEHVGDEQHFKIVSEAGGNLNGSTNLDRTNYFETLPNNMLEIALWLESDRMGFLLDSVTKKKFEVQRGTVKNERGQNYDNRPYGLVNEKTAQSLYPDGHPYSWSTIGYVEDLNRADENDLRRFFLRWYGPNNAALTIAGDVKTQEVVKLVEKYFGPIPRGAEVKPMDKLPAKLDKTRYISYEDNIRNPLLQSTWPSVNMGHPDEPALDALAEIMGERKGSVFYRNFVKPEKAISASVSNPSRELAGSFVIQISTYNETSLAAMDSLMMNSLAEFEKKGVTDEDLAMFKAGYESGTINSLSTVRGKASQLAANQTFYGNANYITKDMERYMKVTKEDVMRVYKQYIKDKPSVKLSVYPKGKQNLIAAPDNYTPPKRNVDNVIESDEYKNLVYNKAKDTFDRGKKPAPGVNPVVNVPDFWTENFQNGLKIIGLKSDELPTVALQLSIEASHRNEDVMKAGISQITIDLMNESTTKHSAEEISDMLDKLGSSLSVFASADAIYISVSSLKKNLDSTLKIAEEVILHPKFDLEDFERSKKNQIASIENQVTQPATLATNIYNKLLYGPRHIMSIPTIGTKNTVEKLTLEDVKKNYDMNISPSVSELVIVGDVAKEEILSKLSFLKNWAAKPVKKNIPPPAPKIDKTRIYFVNKDNAAQSEIRIGYLALPYDALGEYYRAQVMNFTLGGNFNSRINLNIREEKNLSYGAFSNFSGSKWAGPFTAYAGVKGDATDTALVEFMKEIKKFADGGITSDELSYTKNSIGQSDALKYEAPAQKAGFMKRILDYNLSKDYVEKQNEILKNIPKDEVAQLAKKLLPYNNMVIVIVGDKKKNFENLKKLGYEVIELNAEGNHAFQNPNFPIEQKDIPKDPKHQKKKDD